MSNNLAKTVIYMRRCDRLHDTQKSVKVMIVKPAAAVI